LSQSYQAPGGSSVEASALQLGARALGQGLLRIERVQRSQEVTATDCFGCHGRARQWCACGL
jgi:hypothetical protein